MLPRVMQWIVSRSFSTCEEPFPIPMDLRHCLPHMNDGDTKTIGIMHATVQFHKEQLEMLQCVTSSLYAASHVAFRKKDLHHDHAASIQQQNIYPWKHATGF